MRFTAILDTRLWWPAHLSAGRSSRRPATVRQDAAGPATAFPGFAAAMAGLAPQDPLLLAAWLDAEDLLVKPPGRAAHSAGA